MISRTFRSLARSLLVAVAVAVAFPVLAEVAAGVEAQRKFAANASAAALLPGTITIGDTEWDTGTGLGARVGVDFFVSPRLSLGAYVQTARTTLTELELGASMVALGASLFGRFGPAHAGHFRGGLLVGYQLTFLEGDFDEATGFGIGPAAEYVHPTGSGSWFASVSFITQPAGGNGDVDVTWGPIFWLALGAEFGR